MRDIRFDAVVGNPPYQEEKNTVTLPVWPEFLENWSTRGHLATFVHPGRWVIPKKQMEPVRDMLIASGLVRFNYYYRSGVVFPDTAIGGGITTTYFKYGYHGNMQYAIDDGAYQVYIKQGHVFLNDYEKYAFEQITQRYPDSMEPLVYGNQGSRASSEFGYDKMKHVHLLASKPDGMTQPLKVWANRSSGRGSRFGWYYVDGKKIKSVPDYILATRKVMIDKKGNAPTEKTGNVINNDPIIVDQNTIGEGVLFVIPHNNTDYELKLIQSLFRTRTARFLMSITQKDLYVRGFNNIPDYRYFLKELDGKLFTDEFFYKKFHFSSAMIAHIEKYISEKH